MNLLILVTILFCCKIEGGHSDQLSGLGRTRSKHVEYVKNTTNIDAYINSVKINISEDGLLDFKGLAKKYIPSRCVEEYDVITEDMYLLKLFRIPGDINKKVLISHGLLCSSGDFLTRAKKSLIYMLAQENFDIWAINYRGNRYSRRHKILNPDVDTKYWEFSMQEYGYYDLAAVIDFILAKTNSKPLSIIGHSEGSAAIFVLTSQKPEYNLKINIAVAMAPACYISHGGVGLRTLVKLGPVLADIFTAFGIHEISGYNSLSEKLFALICSQGAAGYKMCVDGIFATLSGYEGDNFEPDFLNTVIGHYPAGTSRQNLIHFTQIGNSGKFSNYDFGTFNQKMYGADRPPQYDLKRVTCNIALVAANNDLSVGVKDVEKLRDQLPNVVNYHQVSDDQFTHNDYMWGLNAHKVLYPHVISVLNKFAKL